MNRERTYPRRRVLKSGTIEFGGGVIDCMIRNLSSVGAALEVSTPVGIPESFLLIFRTEGMQKPCRVVWRREKRIGVAFD